MNRFNHQSPARRLWTRAGLALAVLMSAQAAFGSAQPAAAVSLAGAAFLVPGSYALRVIPLADSESNYQNVNDPGPSATVSNNGGTQTQSFDLAPGIVQWTLLGANQTVPSASGTYINDIDIAGIDFPANPPVQWRPVEVEGVFEPNQSWSWTLNAANGGDITMHASFHSNTPTNEFINGTRTVIQKIDATLEFSGNMSGTLQVTHVQSLVTNSDASEVFNGSVSVLGGAPELINTMIVLGNLSTLP